MPAAPSVLIAHQAADCYGSGRQVAETAAALVEGGASVTVVLPSHGPLVSLLRDRGADVTVQPFPVLRRSSLRPVGLLRLAVDVVRRGPSMLRTVRTSGADVVVVNTVVIPWWIAAGRLARRRTLCHVHEAEESAPGLASRLLYLPCLLAHTLIANSAATARVLRRQVPRSASRTVVVHNGVPGPPDPPTPSTREAGDRLEVVLVGRLSEIKGTDVALDAVGVLRSEGRDVRLALCGATADGNEAFEERLRDRASRPDLAGAVDFCGYVEPTWDRLAAADVVLVPSRTESFGNAAVEALLAERPLVASRTQGLLEIVDHGRTGLHAEPGDAESLAAAMRSLDDDPDLARDLAVAGRADATRRFSVSTYAGAIRRTVLGGDRRG